MTYSKTSRSRLTCHISLSLHKHFIESTLKIAITKHFHCKKSIGWRLQVSDPGGDDLSSGGGGDMGPVQKSLEVWTFTLWKGKPLETNGLDAAQGFESGKEHSHIFMKNSLGKWHHGGQSIMWQDGVKVSLTLENLGQ